MAKKILLADDSITIQKVVELTFSDGDYEVTAVNNGAKAIAKLSEMRPDIILSDIIMPEKNGYEVCEYVKSHPEYRNIPVVLLTGTFEPFDPDRADKAGCDAVVTKPFESQSLIHKVEELIAAAKSSAPAAAPAPPEPAASGFATTAFPPPSFAADDSPFAPPPAFEPPPPPPNFNANNNDIFGAPQAAPTPTVDMPFEAPAEPAFGGETRAFPRMSFEELSAAANPPQPEPPAHAIPQFEPSPWDEQPAAPAFGGGGETQAFPRMSFEDLSAAAHPPAQPAPFAPPEPEPVAPPQFEPSPWDEQPAEPAAFGGETRAFPAMSFDELSSAAHQPQATQPEPPAFDAPFASHEPEPPAAPSHYDATPQFEPSPWDEQPAEPAAFGGETRAFPKMSFEDMQQLASPAASHHEPEPEPLPEPTPFASSYSEPEPEPEIERSPWDEPASEPAAFGGETRAFPKMSFEEMQQMAAPAASHQEPEHEFAPPAAHEPLHEATPFHDEPAPSWAPPEEAAHSQPEESESFASTASDSLFGSSSSAIQTEDPFAAPEPEPEPEHASAPAYEEPSWAPAAHAEPEEAPAAAAPQHAFEAPAAAEPPAAAAASASVSTGELTEEQIDRIARRVVQLMSEQVVKNIAWEVIPDLAEMVVKDRIKQLESEG